MSFGDASRWTHPWILDEERSRPIIKKALDLGINFFDTANVYSTGASEEIVGRALKDYANRMRSSLLRKFISACNRDLTAPGFPARRF
nr:aldo/keto reductase [Cohnella candidum]